MLYNAAVTKRMLKKYGYFKTARHFKAFGISFEDCYKSFFNRQPRLI